MLLLLLYNFYDNNDDRQLIYKSDKLKYNVI